MAGAVRTKGGRVLTEEDIDRLATGLETNLDISTWRPRRGRPPLDAAGATHAPRIAVRVPGDVHKRVMARAAREGRSISEVVRDLLEAYAGEAPAPKT
jgi:predicted HicB family RNase H-like nuclease